MTARWPISTARWAACSISWRAAGCCENTVVAVVADHGENLGEHGIRFRHVGLFDTTTHVPLMIRWPGREREGRRIEGLVQTIDLFPTLLAAAGLKVRRTDGQRPARADRRGTHTGRRAVFSEHAGRLGRLGAHAGSTATG